MFIQIGIISKAELLKRFVSWKKKKKKKNNSMIQILVSRDYKTEQKGACVFNLLEPGLYEELQQVQADTS